MRRKLRHGRQKALFGSEEAATLAAAAITAAATAAAAKVGRDATLRSAEKQSQQIKDQARIQSESLMKQNENNTKLNEQIIQANKDIADKQAESQRTLQMNMQLLAGKENMDNRLEMSKMQLAAGGKLSSHNKQSLLRGGNNIRFKLPRRGNVELVGVTPEGYNLYSIYGPSHKSGGVDIDFENGGKIEAEGDAAKTGRNKRGFKLGGEYMLTTPNDAFFISQHDINGFNPAEAVDRGMHPLQAYNIQEINKEKVGINDDGSKRAMNGNSLIAANLNPSGNGNNLILDNYSMIAPIVRKRRLRNGGRVKAAYGDSLWDLGNKRYYHENPTISRTARTYTPITLPPTSTPSTLADAGITGHVDLSDVDLSVKPNTGGTRSGGGFNWSNATDLVGSGIVSLSNFVGALMGQSAANRAADMVANARREGYNMLVDATKNFRGISADAIKNAQVEGVGYIPSLRSVRFNVNPQLAELERDENSYITSLAKNSLSAAGMNKRIGRVLRGINDKRMQVYAEQANRENDIRNKNVDSINEAARFTAESRNQANRANSELGLFAARYNADVNNRMWDIIGNAGAETANSIGDTYANAAINNGNLMSNALTSSGASFASSLSNMAKRKADIEKVLLGADPDNINAYYAYSSNVNERQVRARLQALQDEYNSIKDSNPERAKIIKRRIDEIISARGYNG